MQKKPFSNNLSLPETMKIGSRSPKSIQFFIMSQQYSCAFLVKIHPFLREIRCRQAIFQQSEPLCDLENGHQNLIRSFSCHSNIVVQVWSKSIHSFMRQDADKPFTNNLSPPVTLKMGSWSPKFNQFFSCLNNIDVQVW